MASYFVPCGNGVGATRCSTTGANMHFFKTSGTFKECWAIILLCWDLCPPATSGACSPCQGPGITCSNAGGVAVTDDHHHVCSVSNDPSSVCATTFAYTAALIEMSWATVFNDGKTVIQQWSAMQPSDCSGACGPTGSLPTHFPKAAGMFPRTFADFGGGCRSKPGGGACDPAGPFLNPCGV